MAGRLRTYVNESGEKILADADKIREFKLVKRIVREKERLEAAEKRWRDFGEEKVFPFVQSAREDMGDVSGIGLNGKKRSKTLYGADKEKVTVSYRTYIRVDEAKSDAALDIIRAEVEEVKKKEGKIPELLDFLLQSFKAKTGWKVGPEFMSFVKADFRKRRLKEAQQLLLQAIEPRDSEWYIQLKLPEEKAK